MSHGPTCISIPDTLTECWEESDLTFLKLWAWNNNSSTSCRKTWATHRLVSGESRASLWSLWYGSEETIWRIISKLGTSDRVARSHYDSNFVWTHFQEFQYYDFQIMIAVTFHTDWMSAVFLKSSSNLLALVFQSSGLERPELWHTSVQGFKGNKMQFPPFSTFFHLYTPVHWILPS